MPDPDPTPSPTPGPPTRPDPIPITAATRGTESHWDSLANRTASGEPATLPPDSSDPPGYTIVRELGSGGMGVVYEARDERAGRTVALKMIRPDAGAGMTSVIRFLAEADAQRSIEHPHVVRVFKVGEHAGRPYIALEFCSGGSLADQLKADDRYQPREAAALLAKVARGVAAAHAQGIFHRDLKPANVLFDEQGEPKVADFGLAKRAVSDLTRTGVVFGTPAYMAPEQALGQNEKVGPATDVWALGAILYELLTGVRPFRADSVDALLAQLTTADPDSPRTFAPGLSRDLERVCLKCLEKDPADRYATAEALAEDLDNYLAGRSLTARSMGLVERGLKWARRRPTLAAAYGLGLLAVVLGSFAVLALTLWQRAESDRGQAETARGQAETERGRVTAARDALVAVNQQLDAARHRVEGEKANAETARDQLAVANTKLEAARVLAEAARDELKTTNAQLIVARQDADAARNQVAFLNYANTVRLAQADYRDHEPGYARRRLASCPPELRGPEWNYVYKLCHREVAVCRGHTAGLTAVAYSPDGTRLATASYDGTARVWDARTGKELHNLGQHGVELYDVAFSRDGKRLLTRGGDSLRKVAVVRVWNPDTGRLVADLVGHTNYAVSAEFSRNGSRIVTAGLDRTARVWDAATGKQLFAFTGHTDELTAAAFSPDGSQVLSASKDGTARIWDAATGKDSLVLDGHRGGCRVAAFDPVGKRIVTADDDNTRVWDAKTGKKIATLGRPNHSVMVAAFSPDGTRLLTSEYAGDVRIWDPATGKELVALLGHRSYLGRVRWSRDGTRVVTTSQDRTARVWDAKTGAVVFSMGAHTDWVNDAAFSPDGTRVATAGRDNVVWVWDAAATPEGLAIGGHTDFAWISDFSPDGTRVVTYSQDRTARVWDSRTGRELAVLKGHDGKLTGARFSPRGDRLVTTAESGPSRLWNTVTWNLVAELAGGGGYLTHFAFDADGKRVVMRAGTEAGVWDTATGKQIAQLKGHTQQIVHVLFTPDGRVITSGDDGTRVWDVATGKPVAVLKGTLKGTPLQPLSADGKRIVTAIGSRAVVWETKTGRELGSFGQPQSNGVRAAALSPDGKWAVVGGWSAGYQAFDAVTGKPAGRQDGDDFSGDLTISSDSKRVLTRDQFGGSFHVWDPAGVAPAVILYGHRDSGSCRFSPDGRRVFTASLDETMRIWDPVTGMEMLTLPGSWGGGVIFSAGGARVSTGDGRVPGQRVQLIYDFNSPPPPPK